MKTLHKSLASVIAILSVSACSSNNSVSPGFVSISPAEEAARNFSEVAVGGALEDAGGAIQNGKTLTARTVGVAGHQLNYDTGNTNLANAEVAVRRNANGELSVTLNGVEQNFTTADRVPYGYRIQDAPNSKYVSAYNYTGTIDEFLNPGDGYIEVLGIQSNQVGIADEDNLKAFAVLGTETRDEALASLPTASYNGTARLDAVPNSGFVDYFTSTARIRSDVEMTADFGAGTIGGTMSNFTTELGSGGTRNPMAGTVTMNPATFNVNGFRSTLSADSTLASSGLTLDPGSTFSGAFYGPVANEVGGVMSATGNFDGQGYNAVGFFRADKVE